MKKIKLGNDRELKLHYKPQKHILDKAVTIATQYINSEINARKLSNGLFSVLEVTRNERIVIDAKDQMHFMSHEKYNQFVNQRYLCY